MDYKHAKYRGAAIGGLNAGEWMYGFYWEESRMTHGKIKDPKYGLPVHVHKNSVGQFINKLDKAGKEIYVGDFLNADEYGLCAVQHLENGTFSMVGVTGEYEGCTYNVSQIGSSQLEVAGDLYINLPSNLK